MHITFNMPHVFSSDSNPVENARALRASLDYLIALNLAYLEHNRAPSLYGAGVVYGRTTIWDTIPALYARGFGDCKSLSAALIAEYRRSGTTANPVFRMVKKPDGTTDFHILVQTARGFEDPSKVLGMGKNENAPFQR
jgi:hypothetical protein